MTQEQLDALIAFVQASLSASVYEVLNRDEWRQARFEKAEENLRDAFAGATHD